MGSSAPKSETVVKGGKPVIVREYMAPGYLKELGNMADYWQQRAQQETSTYQTLVNRTLGNYGQAPAYDPMQLPSGEVVKPFQVSNFFNTDNLVNAAKEGGMFKPLRGPIRRKEATPPRAGYLDAVQTSNNKTPTGIFKPGTYQSK